VAVSESGEPFFAASNVVAFVGASGAGKTSAILDLLTILIQEGRAVVCVKRSHHPYAADGSNSLKDSQRLAELAPTYFWGSNGLWDCCSLQSIACSQSFEDWINQLAGRFEIVLIEGGKSCPFSKIELLDSARGFGRSVCVGGGLIATIGDVSVTGVPILQRSRAASWIEFLNRYWGVQEMG
jgi:molybdopterin-guanine dinucleotide biosynthesis protein MobB